MVSVSAFRGKSEDSVSGICPDSRSMWSSPWDYHKIGVSEGLEGNHDVP